MRHITLFCIILLALFTLANSHESTVPDRDCVSSFHEDPTQFDICKTKICFVILEEKPFVFPNPELQSAPSHPFLCRNYGKLNTNLTGLFFDVLNDVSKSVPEVDDAMCIFGGTKCTFDNSVRFVHDAVKSNSKYRFVAGGFFLFLQHRRTQYTVHSHPWGIVRMVVLIRSDDAQHSFALAWKQVFQPFSIRGWSLLLGFALLFFIGLVIHTCRFSNARTFRQLVRWIILAKPSGRGVWETASWNSLKFSVVVFCAILILLYEIAVVNFILQSPVRLVDSGIEEFKKLGVENFAVVRGDASETIFKYAVGWKAKKGKVPWTECNSLKQAIEKVANKGVKFSFAFDIMVANALHDDNLCNKIVAIPTEKKDVGGWFFGTGIPRELRTRIDKALSKLMLKQLPNQWRKHYGVSPLNCGKVIGEVDYKILVVLLALTVGPFLLKHFLSVALSCCWSNIEESDEGKPSSSHSEASDDSSSV